MTQKTQHFFLSLGPYIRLARLDKPAALWLIILPCFWGIFLGRAPTLPLKEMFFLTLGSILIRGAGCTYNDLIDRPYDGQVRRTASRPLVSGQLTPKQAVFFLALQLTSAFIVLLFLPPLTQRLGIASLALIVTYPFMKRITWWPQLFLGLAFNWGIWMGWSCVPETATHISSVFLLYGAGICWTLAYDTIYAYQDLEDDLKIGLKSSALAVGKRAPVLWGKQLSRWGLPKPSDDFYGLFFLRGMYGLMIFFLGLVGVYQNFKTGYYGALGLVFFLILKSLQTLNLKDPKDCLIKFKNNGIIGILITLTLFMASYSGL